MATYSTANGRIGAAAAVLSLVVSGFDGWEGNFAMAATFGFLGLALGLQAGDDLVWQGRQPVVAPLRRAVVVLTVLSALWAAADLLL